MRSIGAIVLAATLLFAVGATASLLRDRSADPQCIALNHDQEALNTAEGRAMMLASYNANLGSWHNISYTDPSVLDSTARMFVGGLRYPGGTQGGWWIMANGSYVKPCKDEKLKYNWCKDEERIEERYPNYFTPGNFATLLAPHFVPTASETDGLRVMFDLNMLTIDEDEAAAQIDLIAATVPNASSRVHYIELGNEYYFDLYRPWLPNASFYMNKARKTIARVRQLLPNAKIAAVSAGPPSQDKDGWDKQLSEFTDLVDAITIHDYTAHIKDYTNLDDFQTFALHAPKMIPEYAAHAKSMFGNKEIWMTEFNAFDKSAPHTGTLAGHSLFIFNYLIAGACESQGMIRVMMTLLWGMTDEYAGGSWGIYVLPYLPDRPRHSYYNGMAQLHARISALAAQTNNATCLQFRESEGCPTAAIGGTSIHCLRGLSFATPDGKVEHVITNGCARNVTASVPLVGPTGNATARVDQYFHLQDGNRVKITDCPGDTPLWECNPLRPTVQHVSGTQTVNGVTYATLEFPMLTVSFVKQE